MKRLHNSLFLVLFIITASCFGYSSKPPTKLVRLVLLIMETPVSHVTVLLAMVVQSLAIYLISISLVKNILSTSNYLNLVVNVGDLY